jgi:hypothetical protein
MANSGITTGGTTDLGVDSRSGSVISAPLVNLRDRARVEGNVISGGMVNPFPTAVITGIAASQANPSFDRYTWTVNFRRRPKT